MVLASGTRVALAYVEEVTRGTTPATPTLLELRATARDVNLEKDILESAEVRSTRQKSDVRHGFNRVVGQPGYELSLAAYDDFIRYAMGSTWASVATTGSPNLAVDSTAGTTALITRAAGSWITDGYRPGDVIVTAGFTNSGNNGRWRVSVVTGADLTILDPTGVTVTEASAAGRTVTYPGRRMDIGATLYTVTLERQFRDVAQYQVFRGVCVDQMNWSIQPEAIIGGTFNLLGMSAAVMAGATINNGGGLPTAAATNSPFAAFDGALYEGGSIIAVATGLDFTLANNRSLEAVIGSKFSPDVFEGQAVITGTLTNFFENATLFNKFVNETESSLWMMMNEIDLSDFVSVVMPRVKYTGGAMNPPQEGPVPLEMPFQALEQAGLAVSGGTTTASSLTIQRSNT